LPFDEKVKDLKEKAEVFEQFGQQFEEISRDSDSNKSINECDQCDRCNQSEIMAKIKEILFKMSKFKPILIENPIIEKSVPKSELFEQKTMKTIELIERNHKNLEEMTFFQVLDLIKARDLKRKPRAYLNAKYPLNEISRAIYAGIATKKAVMDLTKFNANNKRELSQIVDGHDSDHLNQLKKKQKKSPFLVKTLNKNKLKEKQISSEPMKWSYFLENMDITSPLASRIIGVVPNLQFNPQNSRNFKTVDINNENNIIE